MSVITPRRVAWLLAAAALAGAFWWALRDPPLPVDLAAVDRGVLDRFVEETGRTRVRELYDVTSPIAGHLDRLVLEEGDAVIGGQSVIASIEPLDPPFLDARTRQERLAGVEAARAELALARVEHQRARTALALARSELARTRELADRQLVSASTLERAESEVALQQALVDSALAGIRVGEARLASAEAGLTQPGNVDPPSPDGDCCVRVIAPASGRVLRVLVRSAQPVAAGARIAEIGDPAHLELVVELLSRDATRVKPGAPVEILDWGGDPPLRGTVLRVEPAGYTKVSALGIEEQRVQAIIDVDDPPPALGHGFHALARIRLERIDDVLRVPIAALFRVRGAWTTFVVRDGVAIPRGLTLGAMNDALAEVRSGLSDGERVILYPSDLVEDGTRVVER